MTETELKVIAGNSLGRCSVVTRQHDDTQTFSTEHLDGLTRRRLYRVEHAE